LALMRAAGANEVDPADVAFLDDRVHVAQGEPQEYGTQTTCVDGVRVPVNGFRGTEADVNARRQKLGLSTVAANMKRIGPCPP
jgi:hypothetical protein